MDFNCCFTNGFNHYDYNMKLRLILICLCCVFISSCSKQESENKQELNQKIDTLNSKANHYLNIDLDSALYFAEKAVIKAQTTNYPEGEMDGLFQKGRIYYDQARRTLAMDAGRQSLVIAKKINSYQGQKNALNLIGKIQNHANQLEEGIKTIRRNYNLAKAENDSIEMALMSNFKGIFKNKMGDKDSAFYFTMQSLAINKTLKIQKALAYNYNSLGIYYYGEKNLDSSFYYLRKALKIRTELKLPNQSIEAYNNLGYVFLMEGRADSAITYFQHCIKVCLEYEKKHNLAVAYENLADAYEIEGNHQAAFSAFKKAIPIKDSLSGIQQTKQIIKEEKAKNEELKELYVLKKELEKKQWFLIFFLLVILIMTIIIFRKSKRRSIENLLQEQKTKAAKEIIDEYEKIDNWIARELHDDIGGSISAVKLNLSAIESAITLAIFSQDANKQLSQDTPRIDMDMSKYKLLNTALKKEIKNLGDVNNKIRELSHNLVPVSFDGQSFSDLLKVKLSSLFKNSIIFSFQFYPEDELNNIRGDIKFNVYRILQNLANNAAIHSKAKNVNIHVVGHKDHLSLLIEDDGIGFDKGKETDGIGLQIINRRVLLFDGEIEIDSEKGKGTTITIDIPYKNVKI